MRTGRALAAGLAALVLLSLPAALRGEDGASPPAAPTGAPAAPTWTAEQRDDAIVRGFRYVDEEVWKLGEGGSPRKQYTIAVNGLASLLAAERGKADAKLPSRKKEAERARDYVVRYAAEVAALYARDDKKRAKGGNDAPPGAPDGFAGMRGPSQYVWPLGIGGVFLAESAARGSGKKDCLTALRDIVTVLEGAQQTDGGWGHDDAARPGMGLPPIQIPKPGGGTHTYPATLLAASNGALAALGLAHQTLGTAKKSESLAKGREYFTSSQNDSGSWPYDPSQRRGGDRSLEGASEDFVREVSALEVARSGGAAFGLLCAGAAATDPAVRHALEAIDAHPEWAGEGHGSATLALLWSALLARSRGTDAWDVFRRTEFPRILAAQAEDGSFSCACTEVSGGVTCDTKPIAGLSGMDSWVAEARVYVSAVHVLVLVLDRTDLSAPPDMPAPAEVTPR